MSDEVTHGDILLALGRLEGKMDAFALLQKKVEKHDDSINSLERSRAWLLGASAVVSTLVAGVFTFFKG